MKLRIFSNLRASRVMRLAAASLVAGQVLIGSPILAQDAARATVRATQRAAADAERKLANQRVKVNHTVPTVTKPSLEVAFGVDVTTDMLRRVHLFGEPLLPTSTPSDDDNRSLARLLQSIAGTTIDQRLTRIDEFLLDRSAMPWRASLLANAATAYATEGYFSVAAAFWDQAWELTRDATDPQSRAIADYAIGESVTQMMTFGQVARLEARLKEIDGRDVRGPAGAKVSSARMGLSILSTHHEMAVFSGPEALKMYLTVAPINGLERAVRTIAAYHPSMEGTNLAALQALAGSAGLRLEMVHAAPIATIPIPSVAHFRSQHYSAIVGKEGDRYVLRDPALGGTLRVTETALRSESSGYFLVAPNVANSDEWRRVPEGEAAGVWGHCAAGGPSNYDKPCPRCAGGGGPGGGGGMPHYSFHPVSASLIIEDAPLGYAPPVGPTVGLELSYNHRDTRQPQTLTYGNVGPLWTFDSLAYVTDNIYTITPPYAAAEVYLRGHGMEVYEGNFPITHPMSRAQLARVSDDPPRYERRLPDGTVEVYEQPDRAVTEFNRHIFLTELIDPQGHSLTYTYDSAFRIVAITDAIGQVTTLEYLDSADSLHVTRVTDPFSRVATMTYDALGRLDTVTDTAGMTSRFSYTNGDFITAMTTPYGTTTFRHEATTGPNTRKLIEATDPAGGTERLEFHYQDDAIAATESSSLVPTGFAASNVQLDYFNSIYWDKQAMAQYPGDLTKGVITSWMLAGDVAGHHATSRNIPQSIKRPLENRVWYRYPDQASASHHSLSWGMEPALIGRVVDGGASQITQISYNTRGLVTSRIDPAGRQTNYTYASNGIDLLQVEQVRSGGTDVLQVFADYTTGHLPETITDAAGQTTTMTYNAAGQPLTVTNAKNETTTYAYESGTNNLLSVTGPVTGSTTTFSYDAYGRVESVVESDGYTVVTDYDNLNRVTQRTYPDDTTETFTYSRLDLTEQKDRLRRITRHFYDGFGRRIATRDPAGRTISRIWCDCGSLEALVDANGNRTKWERDVQGRVTREIRADNTTDTLYTYDLAGRLKTITDPKDQVTTHSYNLDDSLSGTAYTNEVISTPDVSYTYDPYYARVATMADGIGTTTYTYKASGTNGAGQVASVDGPLTNDTIAYTYDELGRVTRRTINGSANQVDWTFDALGRVTSETNALGEFDYAYDGVTSRLATVTYPNDQTSTYTYYNNAGDRRPQTIHHKYPDTSTLSKFDYTYDAVGNILTWRQQADTTAVMWQYGYDPADQLTSAVKLSTSTPATVLQRFAYAYDPAGNRTIEQIDDAVTLSAYDHLNRLTSHAPGGPMIIAGTLDEPGTVTISGATAIVDGSNNFRGTVPTVTGTNTFTIVAKDATGNTTTQQYEVDVTGAGNSFSYDLNGNLTGDGNRAFTWDALNRLVNVQSGTSSSSYTYDGFSRRTSDHLEVSGTTVAQSSTVWCGLVLCERRYSGGGLSAAYPLGVFAAGVATYFAKDHVDDVTDTSNANASRVAGFAFDPWGRRTRTQGSEDVLSGYTGQDWSATGATWGMTFRDYDPGLGRWLSEDPSGLGSGMNMYEYVDNTPLASVDPLGLIRVNRQQPHVQPGPRKDMPGPAGSDCGRTFSQFQAGGECECRNGQVYASLWLDYRPYIYVATDTRTPPDRILAHEMGHHQIWWSVIDQAIQWGMDLELKAFSSKPQCEGAIKNWELKIRQLAGSRNFWYDQRQRFINPCLH